MKRPLLRIMLAVCVLCLILPTVPVSAVTANAEARNITSGITYTASGFTNAARIFDGVADAGAQCSGDGSITVKAEENIGGLYMKFNNEPSQWKVRGENGTVNCGGVGYYHEFVDISEKLGALNELTLDFPVKVDISEIVVYSEGTLPADVQVWQPVCKEADLLLFSTHSDDDQLYFAGLIPYYTALGYDVEVAYLTNHPDEPVRRHEVLDGLWAAGCRNYPIYADFPDTRLDDLDALIARYDKLGVKYSQLEEYVVSVIRQLKPLVTVTHDVNGEYGHGMHKLLSKLVRDAVDIVPDETKYTSSARKYGVWIMPKTYIHNYSEGQIKLDIDTPLEQLGGKTPFAVSQEAFRLHTSQHKFTSLLDWLYGKSNEITKASQITLHNPAAYGLYASNVGEDINKNDMFENLEADLVYRNMGEYRKKISDLEAAIEILNTTVNELTEQKEALEKKIIEYETSGLEINLLIKERDELAALLDSERSKFSAETERLEGEIETLKTDLETERNKYSELEKENGEAYDLLSSELEDANARLSALNGEIDRLEIRFEDSHSENAALKNVIWVLVSALAVTTAASVTLAAVVISMKKAQRR